MTTWFPIGLDGRSAINVMEGAYGATGGGTSADTTAINAAIAALTSLSKNVLVFPSGYTFLTGGNHTIPENCHVVVMPGATVKAASGQAQGSHIFTVLGDNIIFHIFGTLDGNTQAATNCRLIYTAGYNNITVLGYGRQGIVKNASGRGIWLSNGADLIIDGVVASACGSGGASETEALYVSRHTTAGVTARPVIKGCKVSGYIAIETAVASGTVTDGLIEDCHVTPGGTTNPAIEMWGNDADSMIRCRVVASVAVGTGDIGISVARGKTSAIENCRADNFTTGLELAACNHCTVLGGFVDSQSKASSIGVSVDHSQATGYGNKVIGVTVVDAASRGIKVAQASSFLGYDVVIEGCNIDCTDNSARGINIDDNSADTVSIRDNTIRMRGTSTYGIVIGSGVTGYRVADNKVVVGGSGSPVYVSESTYGNVKDNDIEALASTTNAYELTNVQYVAVMGGTIKGTFSNAIRALATGSGKTVNACIFGGGGMISAGGDGISTATADSGTWGTSVRGEPIEGWGPGGVIERAEISRLTAAESTFLYAGGIVAGDPTTAWSGSTAVPGADGSILQDEGGLVYTLKSGTWTAVN